MRRTAPHAADAKRRCTMCRAVKPITEFGEWGKGGKRTAHCRACDAERAQQRRRDLQQRWAGRDPYAEHPTGEKRCGRCREVRPVREFSLGRHRPDGLSHRCKPCDTAVHQLRVYGIAVGPDDSCAICGTTERLHVDHDHASGQTRGVLCGPCNQGIGFLRDDTELLRKAIDYLRATT